MKKLPKYKINKIKYLIDAEWNDDIDGAYKCVYTTYLGPNQEYPESQVFLAILKDTDENTLCARVYNFQFDTAEAVLNDESISFIPNNSFIDLSMDIVTALTKIDLTTLELLYNE